jgi:ABC-2 type transport system ATP-binding protein
LTLVANAGEVFGLLGSNGAGKSTTIKMLTTLLPPSSGEARVGGFSITTQPVEVRRVILVTTIVLVFIGARLYPQLGV